VASPLQSPRIAVLLQARHTSSASSLSIERRFRATLWAKVPHTNARNSRLDGSGPDEMGLHRPACLSREPRSERPPAGALYFQNFTSLASRRFSPPWSNLIWINNEPLRFIYISHASECVECCTFDAPIFLYDTQTGSSRTKISSFAIRSRQIAVH
jgi:hypothetical protein